MSFPFYKLHQQLLIRNVSWLKVDYYFFLYHVLRWASVLSYKWWLRPQGLTVIFSHRQVYVKREGRTLFLLPKVKVEFRHLFSLHNRFSLCSYHNINANIVVFCWLTGLQWNNTRSGQLLIILISGLYGLNNIDRNKKNRNIILKSRKKVNLNLLH